MNLKLTCLVFNYLVNFGIPGEILPIDYCSSVLETLAWSPTAPISPAVYFSLPVSMQSVPWGCPQLFWTSLLDTTFLQLHLFGLLLGRNNSKVLKEMYTNNCCYEILRKFLIQF
jgi:hypothetical protein